MVFLEKKKETNERGFSLNNISKPLSQTKVGDICVSAENILVQCFSSQPESRNHTPNHSNSMDVYVIRWLSVLLQWGYSVTDAKWLLAITWKTKQKKIKTNEQVLQSKLVNEIIYDQLVRTDFHYIPSPRRRCQASFWNEIHLKCNYVAKKIFIKNWSSHVDKSWKPNHRSYNAVFIQMYFYFKNGIAYPFIGKNIAPTSFHFTCRVEVKRSLRFVHYKLTLNTDSFYLSTMVIINKGYFETEWSANWSEVICVIPDWLFWC